MLQRHSAFEAEFGRDPLKSGNGDRVIERIVHPAQVSGVDLNAGCARDISDNHVAEADALTVTVDGGVVHLKNRHSGLFRESRHPESHRSRP